MIAEQLKKAVLQAAIQGKLTQQLPEDGDARDLLIKIHAEKSRLVKEGKIKQKKPLAEITEDDIPFDIPGNWVWSRLGSFSIMNPRNKLTSDTQVSFIPMKFIDDGYSNNFSYEVRPWGEIKSGYTHFSDNDVVIAKITPCFQNRKSAVMRHLKNGYGAGTTELHVIRPISNIVVSNYLLYLFKTEYFISDGVSSMTGTAGQQRVGSNYVQNFLCPIPPFREQERIICRIQDLLKIIDDLEKDEIKLDNIQKSFPKQMKASILQAAIQGKLTEQLPEDGDARELLREIQAEKSRLVKEGKIKKEKPLSEITEDEIPFDIPENWCWVRLGVISKITNGFTPLRSNNNFWNSKDIPWFTIKDIRKQGRIITYTEQYISNSAINNSERIVPADSVLLCCTASVGEYALTKIDLTTNQQFNGITILDGYKTIVSPMYMFFYVQTLSSQLIAEAGKTTFPFLSTKKLANFIIPLPPIAEQKRIVDRLEELVPLCDSLE